MWGKLYQPAASAVMHACRKHTVIEGKSYRAKDRVEDV
jgi:hypothetical protein